MAILVSHEYYCKVIKNSVKDHVAIGLLGFSFLVKSLVVAVGDSIIISLISSEPGNYALIASYLGQQKVAKEHELTLLAPTSLPSCSS